MGERQPVDRGIHGSHGLAHRADGVGVPVTRLAELARRVMSPQTAVFLVLFIAIVGLLIQVQAQRANTQHWNAQLDQDR
jgi:hypothetical protein